MYPTLSHLIKDLTGVDFHLLLATFGFFVTISFLLSAYFLKRELMRKEKEGLLDFFFNKKKEIVYPHQIVADIMLIAAITGVIGARVFSILEYPDEFIYAPIETLFSFSGLTFYGGLIFGSIAVVIYTRKKGIITIHLLDASAPALMLAYAVGRIGCQLAGDGDWGIDNLSPKPEWMSFLPDWFWAYSYPGNVLNEGVPFASNDIYCHVLQNPVFPTPLYETIMCSILFIFLWAIRKQIHTAGLMFSIYLMLNGIERFFIEKIRIDSEYHIFHIHFKQATFISVFIFLAGLFLAGISLWQKKYSQTN